MHIPDVSEHPFAMTRAQDDHHAAEGAQTRNLPPSRNALMGLAAAGGGSKLRRKVILLRQPDRVAGPPSLYRASWCPTLYFCPRGRGRYRKGLAGLVLAAGM